MRHVPGLVALTVVGLVCFPPTACTVRSDEFLCEDAVAKIDGCCSPGSTSNLRCEYEAHYCTSPVLPSFDERQSRCILSASCSELRGGACVRGVCQ